MGSQLISDTKQNILIVQLVSNIIISILKIRDIYKKVTSKNLIEKFAMIKDISEFTYDLLTLNLFSILFHSLPLYLKLKKVTIRLFNKLLRRTGHLL